MLVFGGCRDPSVTLIVEPVTRTAARPCAVLQDSLEVWAENAGYAENPESEPAEPGACAFFGAVHGHGVNSFIGRTGASETTIKVSVGSR